MASLRIKKIALLAAADLVGNSIPEMARGTDIIRLTLIAANEFERWLSGEPTRLDNVVDKS